MPISVRLPPEVRSAIREVAQRTGREFSSVTNEMLAEAVKMRRIPGIVFADGVNGRVPRVAGTGLEVFEVVSQYREVGDDWAQLRECYPTLSEHQLRASLAYAAAYPEEVEDRLRREERWSPDAVWGTFPFTKPSRR